MSDSIFHAYDVRGTYPDKINEAAVEQIATAYAYLVKPKKIAVGRDVRLSSPSLAKAVISALVNAGVSVVDIGMVPTELLYFAVGAEKLDGGIQVTASHNPAQYNGMKMVKAGVQPISADNGLKEMEAFTQSQERFTSDTKGKVETRDVQPAYLDYIAKLVDLTGLPPLTIVANNNFGQSGLVAKAALAKLKAPVKLIELNFTPDGSFPKGRPDPARPENRGETSALVREQQAQLGVAWDADGDRCFIADETGRFIEGCFLTALLAEHLLKKNPGQKVIYDPRNVWAAEESIKAAGGVPLLNKAGHTFIKARMRQENALFAGEMSGHYYYHDFWNADSGVLTLLRFLEIIAQSHKTVSQLAAPLRQKYFVSGEINFKVANPAAAIQTVEQQLPDGAVDQTDGLSKSFTDWRFNLRPSNTEPLLRLNVEARSAALCEQKTNELTKLLEGLGA